MVESSQSNKCWGFFYQIGYNKDYVVLKILFISMGVGKLILRDEYSSILERSSNSRKRNVHWKSSILIKSKIHDNLQFTPKYDIR